MNIEMAQMFSIEKLDPPSALFCMVHFLNSGCSQVFCAVLDWRSLHMPNHIPIFAHMC